MGKLKDIWWIGAGEDAFSNWWLKRIVQNPGLADSRCPLSHEGGLTQLIANVPVVEDLVEVLYAIIRDAPARVAKASRRSFYRLAADWIEGGSWARPTRFVPAFVVNQVPKSSGNLAGILSREY
jgi:hypothetical protein